MDHDVTERETQVRAVIDLPLLNRARTNRPGAGQLTANPIVGGVFEPMSCPRVEEVGLVAEVVAEAGDEIRDEVGR